MVHYINEISHEYAVMLILKFLILSFKLPICYVILIEMMNLFGSAK